MPLKYYEKWVLTKQEDRQISCVDFSPDGKYVAYGSREALAIVTLESGELKCRVLGSSPITALSWLSVGGNVLLCAYRDGVISRLSIGGVSIDYHEITMFLPLTTVTYFCRIIMSMHG